MFVVCVACFGIMIILSTHRIVRFNELSLLLLLNRGIIEIDDFVFYHTLRHFVYRDRVYLRVWSFSLCQLLKVVLVDESISDTI